MTNKADYSSLKASEDIKERLQEEFPTLISLAASPPDEIVRRCEINRSTAERLVNQARKLLGKAEPITAAELLEQRLAKPRITTSSQQLDEILGGGVAVGAITEFSGAFSTGKTQLAFQLCINVQRSFDEGGLEGTALFIDTENTFSPARVAEMSYSFTSEPKEILKKIFVSRAYNADHQVQIVQKSDKLIRSNDVKLIVVDSMASHFRAEFPGKDNLPRRQQMLMAHAEVLQRLAEAYDLAVMTTNQILSNPDSLLSNNIEPALGFAWGHRPTHRILLRKSRGTTRIARIFDSPELAEREAVFHITAQGIRDGPPLDY
ncbi:MAG: DNA repair and recombination protein RadA [Candidatus Heimdallarchaeota archaeon]|nr:DNA repair and recombination protein RadA [Candidatus Heimdallarchaeota archaeon]